jgi:hypothetical protein
MLIVRVLRIHGDVVEDSVLGYGAVRMGGRCRMLGGMYCLYLERFTGDASSNPRRKDSVEFIVFYFTSSNIRYNL